MARRFRAGASLLRLGLNAMVSPDAFEVGRDPRSQLHVFRGGHLGLVTEATEVAPVIGGFLASDAGSGRAG